MHGIIALGNPGARYSETRHNIGFIVLDNFARKHNIPFSSGKGDYYFGKSVLFNKDVVLVKPVTYMNKSGMAVKQVLEHFNIEIDNTLVVCDDLNLPFGTIRFRKTGSDGGHNGLKSIIYHLSSSNFPRLRFGIGGDFTDQVDFVLSPFSENEKSDLPGIVDFACKGIGQLLEKDINFVMNNFNRNLFE